MNQQQKIPTIQECRAALCTDLWRIVQFYAQPNKLNLTAEIKDKYNIIKMKKHQRRYTKYSRFLGSIWLLSFPVSSTSEKCAIYKKFQIKAQKAKDKAAKYESRTIATQQKVKLRRWHIKH